MSKQIDLHVHSTASDGSVPPGELPALAVAAGLGAIALTDHDTVAGLAEFQTAATLTDHDTVAGLAEFQTAATAFPELEAINGVELSVLFGSRELHFLGLFIDPASPELNDFLERQRRGRIERGERLRLKLRSLGYPLSEEDLRQAGAGDTVGRPHFARALVKKYGFADVPEVFGKLLKHGAPAYVPRRLPEPAAALDVIRAAGGVAVWAHPVYRQRNERAFVRRIMRKFAPLGLAAAEGYYSLFGPEETALVKELAAEYGLAISGGSDFHGKNTPGIQLGAGAGKLRVPGELLPLLKAKIPN